MVETVQVRVRKQTHKKLLDMRKTNMGTVRLYDVIDKLVEEWEGNGKKKDFHHDK
ncbi:MAG: hypothetical protein V1802_00920 [Candidatus Aenigmatarchaeota archaeon]